MYAIHELCMNPEYIEPLRQEIEAASEDGSFENKNQQLPLMDSFLRESARMNPLDACESFKAFGSRV